MKSRPIDIRLRHDGFMENHPGLTKENLHLSLVWLSIGSSKSISVSVTLWIPVSLSPCGFKSPHPADSSLSVTLWIQASVTLWIPVSLSPCRFQSLYHPVGLSFCHPVDLPEPENNFPYRHLYEHYLRTCQKLSYFNQGVIPSGTLQHFWA